MRWRRRWRPLAPPNTAALAWPPVFPNFVFTIQAWRATTSQTVPNASPLKLIYTAQAANVTHPVPLFFWEDRILNN